MIFNQYNQTIPAPSCRVCNRIQRDPSHVGILEECLPNNNNKGQSLCKREEGHVSQIRAVRGAGEVNCPLLPLPDQYAGYCRIVSIETPNTPPRLQTATNELFLLLQYSACFQFLCFFFFLFHHEIHSFFFCLHRRGYTCNMCVCARARVNHDSWKFYWICVRIIIEWLLSGKRALFSHCGCCHGFCSRSKSNSPILFDNFVLQHHCLVSLLTSAFGHNAIINGQLLTNLLVFSYLVCKWSDYGVIAESARRKRNEIVVL